MSRPSWPVLRTVCRSPPASRRPQRHLEPCPPVRGSSLHARTDKTDARGRQAPGWPYSDPVLQWSRPGVGRNGDRLSQPIFCRPGATHAGSAVTKAEAAKTRKYATLASTYNFSSLAFETLGGPGPLTAVLIAQVGEALQRASGHRRLGRFLAQRLFLDVQRGIAISRGWEPCPAG